MQSSGKSRASTSKERDLHGNAPDNSQVAVLLIDVINDLEFPGGERLFEQTPDLSRALAELSERARRANVPCIYANDNFGRWRSDFNTQIEHCLNDGVRGEALVRALRPRESDYFVLKPKHSAFYQTCLGLLLEHLGVQRLLIGGISTESCVMFTAHDAYLRGFDLTVLQDGCAGIEPDAHKNALAHMQTVLKARALNCADVSFAD
jgi:nicotinamidase-related amidase